LTSLGVVASLLQGKAIRDINKTTERDGETPLFLAVKHGHTDVALALVRTGGSVNLTDTWDMSPLVRAASDGRASLVNDLLLRGASVDTRVVDGDRALDSAVRLGHFDVVKVLLQAGSSPGTRGKVATGRIGSQVVADA
ncbi:unnamed protein product, partial [Laminaria digitata]